MSTESLLQWAAIAVLLLCAPINYMRVRQNKPVRLWLRVAGYLAAATVGAFLSAVLIGLQIIPTGLFLIPLLIVGVGHHYIIKRLSSASQLTRDGQ